MSPRRPSLADPSCTAGLRAVHDALDLLGGKWKLPIILALSTGPLRFKQLQREIADVTAKMLSKELKDLEQNQLVTRTVYTHEAPIAVAYALAPYVETLMPVIRALGEWGQRHRERLMSLPAMPLPHPEHCPVD